MTRALRTPSCRELPRFRNPVEFGHFGPPAERFVGGLFFSLDVGITALYISPMDANQRQMEQRIWLAFEESNAWSDLEDEFWEHAEFTPMFEDGKWQVLVEIADKRDTVYNVTINGNEFIFTKEE